ncbi:Probable transmembrane GTPase FZO-like, chloroplastic [Galdieria sulphuraria]|uniref:Dynamin family protein n=1 Tax=Galdieria sulphuraria TaxID=130081 RepID=M2XTQ2_GALSU|nr:dynamin family protein [Galdieria sulphuraria]EME26789.1 dynamin family protein [Galdieria sulphuraria]GJD11272.1 Probable transmembrane GTPase FZO-like, chloroplastic [Galdieria sulphuraria]|eukprot:XP_005703309.1 dynamin family protein [Galdieria sulphuraria]
MLSSFGLKLSKTASSLVGRYTSYLLHSRSYLVSLCCYSSSWVPSNSNLLLEKTRSHGAFCTTLRSLCQTSNSTLNKLSEIADADLVRRERFVLQGFLSTLEKFPYKNERDINLLKEVIRRLDGLFLLVVVGEFNSGKSSLINALLGGHFLPQGPTPTTAQVSLVKGPYSSSPDADNYEADYHIYSVPVPWLKYMNIVDTPGTNAIEQAHEILTKEFVPRADLILFTTSADRPFSESERRFLEEIRNWGKKVIIVLNKIDLLMDSDQPNKDSVQAVVHYVRDHARIWVGSDPQIFPVSSRLALLAKERLHPTTTTTTSSSRNHMDSNTMLEANHLLEASRFPSLEAFITKTLDDRERWKIKLETPLALAQSMQKTYQTLIKSRKDILEKDLLCISDIQESLQMYREDFNRESQSQLVRIDNIILRLQQRASQFFYERIQLRYSIPLLRNNQSLSPELESVLGNTAVELEQEVLAMVGWLQEKNRRHWKEISRLYDHRLNCRQRELEPTHSSSESGSWNGHWVSALQDLSLNWISKEMDDWDMDAESKRQMTLTELKRASTDLWHEKFSSQEEAQRLVLHVRKSLLTMFSAQAGALGLLGTLSILSTLDISGIIFTCALAIASTGVFPYRKKQFLRTFHSKMDQFRHALREEIEKELRHQLDQHIVTIENAMAPFSRFIRSRKAMVLEEEQQLSHIASQISMMRDLISNRFESEPSTPTLQESKSPLSHPSSSGFSSDHSLTQETKP